MSSGSQKYGRDARRPLTRLATWSAVAVAATLIAIKFAAWLMTGSVAMLSTLLDSVLDATASLLNLIAVHHAARPADREHRFGHGKAEPLAGIGQTLLIGASGSFLLFEAVPRLFQPQPVVQAEVGMIVMVISIALTGSLVLVQRHVVRRTGSVAIQADALHYLSDLLTNGSIIVALVLSSYLGWHIADPIFAIAISAYVIYTAVRVARTSLDILMDRELPDADRERIKQICRKHPHVRGIRDLRTRSSGLSQFVQLNLEMDGSLSLRRAHDIATEVAAQIQEAFPDAEVTIHEEPLGAHELTQA
jgi:ferrous-iron efflux pump FieF